MTCAVCGRKPFKQFIREDKIVCYLCRDIFDTGVKKIKDQ
jgi:hypothetical protein